MKLLKPSWVSHDGHPIFSIDIHPDGSRFATGGQGADTGRIVIWNMAPVTNEADEKDENVPKRLCQMDNHLACVNCVRWSHSGKYLASCGDDKVLMIWQIGRYVTGSAVFGTGGKMANIEHWRCVSTLRGHSGDVLDLAWSPNDAWLASCSVDNTIVIWNALKWQEIIAVLKGHTGLVKGVCWDPVGKYVASQSDDKTLRVWRTHDWQQEALITEPFLECGGTTHILRLGWSPDGQSLVSAHAMNNSGPTAQIIDRDGWKTNKDFVGHRKAITCVRFNPNILFKTNKDTDKVQQFCCCAIGSRDRSLSIWLTYLKRPLVVVHDLFSNSVLDISWSLTGHQTVVCSWDGTVAYIEFSPEEIGRPVSTEKKNTLHQKLYGKSMAMTNHTASSALSVIENPDILKLQEEQKIKEEQVKKENSFNSTPAGNDSMASKLEMATPKYRPPPCIKGPTDKQIETRLADGRRRITPLFIPPPPDVGDVPLPFNSRAPPTFSSSKESKSRIVIEKREELCDNSSEHSTTSRPAMESTSSFTCTTTTTTTMCTPATPVTTLANCTSVIPSSVVVSSPTAKVPPNIGSQKITNGSTPKHTPVTSVIASVVSDLKVEPLPQAPPQPLPPPPPSQQAPETLPQQPSVELNSDKAKENLPSKVKESVPNKSLPSSTVAPTATIDTAPIHIPLKRKADAAFPSVSTPRPEKKKPGRPPSSHTQQILPRVSVEAIAQQERPTRLEPGLHLPILKVDKTANVLIFFDEKNGASVNLEIENNVSAGAGMIVHRLKCLTGSTLMWEVALSSKGAAAAGSKHVVSVVCDDNTLSTFSLTGRRLYPPIVLTSAATRLTCSCQFVMIITCRGYISVWDILKHQCLIQNESLLPIMQDDPNGDLTVRSTGLTENGIPMISLSTGKSYVFSSEMKTWLLVSDTHDVLQHCSEQQLRLSAQDLANGTLLPLATLQNQSQSESMRMARGIFSSDPNMRQIGTLSHLDCQLASSLSLHSSKEYHFWLLSLVRYLVQEGLESRLRDVCDGLLGPVVQTTKTSWQPSVLEMQKRELLKEVLPIIGSNLRFQRLFTEYKDQLELMDL